MVRLIPVLLALLLSCSAALARGSGSTASLAEQFPFPPIRAKAAIVVDASTGAVLGGVNEHLRLPMASTTKIMTAVLALQMGQLTDRITVPKGAFNYEWDATVMGLHPGQVVTLKDLLYGLLLPSGADAANTIAIHYGGSEAHFVTLMNAEAARLGMKDTHYVNAHGLSAPNHYSSAYDLALLGEYATHFPALMQIVRTRTYGWHGHTLVNVNHVLFWYPGVDGIKPGYTDEAGLCQVLDAQRDSRHIIAVTLHTPDLVFDARNLLNYGLQDYSWAQSPITYDNPGLVLKGITSAGPYQYFVSTGHYLRGAFLAAYTATGGAPVLGYPRTESMWKDGTGVQYFENGALSWVKGKVTRLKLGLNAVSPLRVRLSTPAPEPTAVATTRPVRTSTPVIRTPTPTPRARATPTPTPRPLPPGTPAVAADLAMYYHRHSVTLGLPVAAVQKVPGYRVQIFEYGALAYSFHSRQVYILPLGDHVLAAQHYLPAHPGDRYPAGFAPSVLLSALNWVPSPPSSQAGRTRHTARPPMGHALGL